MSIKKTAWEAEQEYRAQQARLFGVRPRATLLETELFLLRAWGASIDQQKAQP